MTREGAEARALAFAHEFVKGYDTPPVDTSDDVAVFAHVYGPQGEDRAGESLFGYFIDEVEVGP